ncbi:signal peptidase I [Actinomadura opuntiae]|uniref:signal peptidase I n=1 Tax=Actinomadura sp. OS1-43 TaxID=604315 RepID=UPI00255B228F|nr:signal peptidase I [Actinomadura sp. OS1-43]MDL4818848.1 signal peptidase I [Actinomadura sp. OS1-43]
MRSEAEGAVPDEEETVTSAGETADDDSADDDGKGKKKRQGSFWKELPILIVVAVVLALVIKAFAVQAFYIPSGSMENTLQIGDRVLVNKIVYHTRDIRRGDVVVFNGLDSWDPETHIAKPTNPFSKALRAVGTAFGVAPNEKDYIKRVIGVPGDHVHCCDAQGRVTVTDSHGVVRTLEEKSYLYTDPVTHEQNKPSNEPFDAYVKPGQLWVMGDHRDLSYDSRSHRGDPGGGTIPTDRVIGRAFVIVWPLNRIDSLPIPDTFKQAGTRTASLAAPATPMTLAIAGTLPLAYLRRKRHPK